MPATGPVELGRDGPGPPRDPETGRPALDRVAEFVSIARSDFRDVLAPAECPEFFEIGFVGVEELSPEEVGQLQDRDWQQFQAWLIRE